MSAHIPREKLEKAGLDSIMQDIKDSLGRAYYQGYMDAKDELVREAKALVKLDKEKEEANKI